MNAYVYAHNTGGKMLEQSSSPKLNNLSQHPQPEAHNKDYKTIKLPLLISKTEMCADTSQQEIEGPGTDWHFTSDWLTHHYMAASRCPNHQPKPTHKKEKQGHTSQLEPMLKWWEVKKWKQV